MADTSIYTDPTNMDKDNVQLSIWNGTKWVELSNGYTINQINTNIHEIADKVAEAQQGIAQATTDAQNAVDTANNAITKAGFATDTATTAKQVADTANSVATQAQSDIATAKSNITTVSNDLATAKTDLTSQLSTAKTNISSISSDLATAKTNITNNANAISDAKGNISSLQSSSSKLESDMTDAKGNISTLQQDSTSFKSEIGNLQSDNSTNKSNISSLQQTANGLTSTVASVQTQVNNSAVGTNLLIGTNKDWKTYSFNNGDWGTGDQFTLTNTDLKPNTDYTFQSELMSANSYEYHVEINAHDSSGNNSIIASGNTVLSGVSSVKFNTGDFISFDLRPHVMYGHAGAVGDHVQWRHEKLEKGSVVTDWVPNPSDTATVTQVSTLSNTVNGLSSTVSTVKNNTDTNTTDISNLKQTSSGLTSTVSSLQSDNTTNKSDISQLKQTATGLENNVSSLQSDNTTNKSNISSLQQTANGLTSTVASVQTQVNNSAVGTNLLYGTSEFSPWNGSVAFTPGGLYGLAFTLEKDSDGDMAWHLSGTANGSGAIGAYNLQLKNNYPDSYTFSIYAKGTFANTVLNAFQVENSNNVVVSIDMSSSSSYHRWTSKGTTNNGTGNAIVLYFGIQSGDTVDIWIKKWKLEKGSVATDYSANPSDNATVTALSSVKQEADSISTTVTNNKTSSDSQFSTINQTISGIQSTVSNKADSSTVTQLSNLVNTKVNSSDYNSEITQLSSDINLRVKTGDLISQINQQAGGNTLIQVASGKGKLYLDASSVVFGGTAFITSAMISSISADDITTGTMTAGAINLGNGTFKVDTKGSLTSSNATITGGSLKVGSNFSVNTSGILTANGATINGNLNVNSSGNLTTIDSNGFHNYDGDGNDIYIKNGTFKSTMYDEAYNATTSIEVQEGKLVAAYNDENISIYVGRQTAPVILWSDGSQIESSSGSLAVNSNKDMQFSSSGGSINFSSPSNTNVTFQPNGGGGVVFGALANFTKNAIVGADQSGDQIWVRGDGNFNGKVSCQSLTQTSLLSKKTNITKLNIQDVINAINSTEIYEYSFKRDLEQGVNKRYASYIIDDVNEVAQYNEPSEFLSDDKKGRDDGTQLAYLTLMVQEMYKEIQELKNK